jgi:hypothetical protein
MKRSGRGKQLSKNGPAIRGVEYCFGRRAKQT